MKRKTDTACGIFHYLETSGVLDTGSAEEIALYRKKYWNECKRKSKAEKRKSQKEFKVYLTPAELQIIAKGAKAASQSRTGYIKMAALAYAARVYFVPDKGSTLHIRQLLSLNYDMLQEIAEENMVPSQAREALTEAMERLEQTVLAALCNPPTIEDSIKEAVAKHAEYKDTLLQLLQKL